MNQSIKNRNTGDSLQKHVPDKNNAKLDAPEGFPKNPENCCKII